MSNHCTVSSEVQAIFLFAHVYVGFLKETALCFGIVWRIVGVHVFSTRQARWGIVTDMLQCTFLYILDPRVIWRYLYRVKRRHWIIRDLWLHQVLHGMRWLMILLMTNVERRYAPRCGPVSKRHRRSGRRVLLKILYLLQIVICCFHFHPLLVQIAFVLFFRNNQVKKYAGYFCGSKKICGGVIE